MYKRQAFNEGVLNAYENANIQKLSQGIKSRENSSSASVVNFAGAYSVTEGDTSVRLEFSLYSDLNISSAVAGEEVGTIYVEIALGEEIITSRGYLAKDGTNTYLVSDSDLNGATVTAFSNCVIVLDSCGFDDTYTLVERYRS